VYWKGYKYYIIWVCVCNFSFPAWNAQGPYYLSWYVRLYNIIPHYIITGKIIEKNIIEHKMRSSIFLQILPEKCLILRRTERDMIKLYIGVLHLKWRYCCHILMKLKFSKRAFGKHSNIKFYDNESSCSMRTDGRTDRHERSNNRLSQFCEIAHKSNDKSSA